MPTVRLFIGITVLTGCKALRFAQVAQSEKFWSEGEVVAYMTSHPSRAYFSRLFRDGGFRVGMEVGVADGRFSEHFLKVNYGIGEFTWHMVEPFPNTALVSRYPHAGEGGDIGIGFELADKPWAERNIGDNANKIFHRAFSNNKSFLKTIRNESLDFVYLDGAHEYPYVKGELEEIWPKVRIGGVIAGHDYCDHGEKEGFAFKQCRGCGNVPRCVGYTDYGIRVGHKPSTGIARSQHGVVQSVHEFLVKHPTTELHHTLENFTRESLSADGIEYDLIIANTYNPSWYFVKNDVEQSEKQNTELFGIERGPKFNLTVCETVKGLVGCDSWCLQPPWQPKGPKATHLDCCVGSQSGFVTHEPWDFQTLIVGYLFTGEATKLRLHFQRWATLSFSTLRKLEFLLVVDADEEFRHALWPEKNPWDIILEETHYVKNQSQLPVIHIVSIDTFKPWNIGGKRNLLFNEARTVNPNAWVLMLDADLVFEENFLAQALDITRTSRDGTAHQFNRKRPSGQYEAHPGAMLIQIKDYWKSGGCDEDFVGHYGQTDPHFSKRLSDSGLKNVYHEEMVLTELPKTEQDLQLEQSLKLDRSTTYNEKLFNRKNSNGNWSNIYLRFDWGRTRRTLKPSLKSEGCS